MLSLDIKYLVCILYHLCTVYRKPVLCLVRSSLLLSVITLTKQFNSIQFIHTFLKKFHLYIVRKEYNNKEEEKKPFCISTISRGKNPVKCLNLFLQAYSVKRGQWTVDYRPGVK